MQYQQQQAGWSYINRIRNPRKRAYAVAYMRSKVGFDPEPQAHDGIGTITAQAVRIRLDAILEC